MGRWLIVALLAVTPARAEPDFHSANNLVPFCAVPFPSTTWDSDHAFMLGYCWGTVFTLTALTPTFGVCLPKTGTEEQIMRVVVKYISDRPARMHEPFVRLAIEALQAAWPCKQ
jgi:hypothetical protein